MISREQRTPFSEWWWTVDRLLLAAFMTLMLGGVILSLAASPPVAVRIGLDPFHFFNRHVLFLVPSMIVMLAVSFLSPRQVRRTALLVFAISIVLVVATLLFGPEVKGAKRWITILGINIQASESLKPAFVVLVAWLFAESAKRPEMPATSMALGLLLMTVTLLVLEPDFGQTMLILMVWGTLFFIAGMRMIWVFGLMGAGAVGCSAPTCWCRMSRGVLKDSWTRHRATPFRSTWRWSPSLMAAGSGKGPGEGTVKRILPDSHTDFVFAVAAEEFGIILCLALLALFAFIVIRALSRAYASEDLFARFAAAGLAIMFGIQASINMAVNLHLMPAKGMTLPFISYGGSSMISLAYGVGMLLALTRQRPRVEMESIGAANAAHSFA